jgi:hypothetical protein
MSRSLFVRIPAWVWLLVGLILGIPLGAVTTRLLSPTDTGSSGRAQGAALPTIQAWAAAAETGDTGAMLRLMPDTLTTATWREVWPAKRQTYQVYPGYAISSLEERGTTTHAIVHFGSNRFDSVAVCVPVEVIDGLVSVTGTESNCAFPQDPVR